MEILNSAFVIEQLYISWYLFRVNSNDFCFPSISLPPIPSDEGALQFKTRTSFTNVDDYARYVRDNVAVGMLVRCCEASNIVQKEDVGEITTVR